MEPTHALDLLEVALEERLVPLCDIFLPHIVDPDRTYGRCYLEDVVVVGTSMSCKVCVTLESNRSNSSDTEREQAFCETFASEGDKLLQQIQERACDITEALRRLGAIHPRTSLRLCIDAVELHVEKDVTIATFSQPNGYFRAYLLLEMTYTVGF